MKKILSLVGTMLLTCTLSHAEYTAENKIIKVVISQPPASGLGNIYNHIEAYAKKQNITLVPIFKPGANGKIGIQYASEQKNDGNTLLFTTLSDFVDSANDANFDKVSPVTKTELVLVASVKSKIKDVGDIVTKEKTAPGQLTWAYASSAQSALIVSFVRANQLDYSKIYTVPFSSTYQTSIAQGEVDLGFMQPSIAESLAAKGYVTLVDVNESIKQEMSKKENGTALFLPKNSATDASTYWSKFVKGLYNDAEFKQALKNLRVKTYKNASAVELEKIINDWKI